MFRWILAAVVLLSVTCTNARGGQLELLLFEFPDIASGLIEVNYVADSDLLTATGFAIEFDDDGVGTPEPILNGTFDLSATIDGSGDLFAGSVQIGGTIPNLGLNSGTLLTGNLTDFGFPDAGGDPFEFIFDVTGGDAAPFYTADPLTSGGIILTGTGFGGSFDEDFNNIGTGGVAPGLTDTGVVPEPSSAAGWLLAFGTAVIGCYLRRSRRAA